MPFRPAPVPTAFVAVGLLILVNLGGWQLRRHVQSQDHRADVRARLYGDPVGPDALDGEADALAWSKAVVRGTFEPTPRALVRGRFEFGHPGYDLVQVLDVEGGPRVLVNRGWIPASAWAEGLARAETDGPVVVEGLLQPLTGPTDLEPSPADADHPATWPMETRTWMGLPVGLLGPPYAAIAASVEGELADVYLVAGPALTRGQAKDPDQVPVSGYVAEPKFIGHLSYSVQWFLIAATLLVIWIALGIRRGRRLADDASA